MGKLTSVGINDENQHMPPSNSSVPTNINAIANNKDNPHHASEIHVLLIEDNEGDAYLVRKLLTKGNFATFIINRAATLKQVENVLKGKPLPDIVLLDLNLPDSSGEETLLAVKTQLENVPIVVFTGITEKALAKSLLDMGVYGFIRKDELTESVIFNTVYGCLKRHAVEQQLVKSKQEAEAANNEKTKFLGNMSHELRTPLTAILGFTTLLEGEVTNLSK